MTKPSKKKHLKKRAVRANNMKEFITYILEQVVTNTDEIKVNEITQNGITIYEIEVNEDDMGLAIGKNGRTIRSIRSLVKAKAIKDGVRIRVELLEKGKKPEEEPENEESEA